MNALKSVARTQRVNQSRQEPDNLWLRHIYVEPRNLTVANIRSSKVEY